MKRNILLEDGTLLEGEAIGKKTCRRYSEIVFNTAMTGYQEIITDPSYKGQTVCFTNPLIGNYGIISRDSESLRPCLSAIVVSTCTKRPSNWQSYIDLSSWLERNGIPGVSNIDTRYLALTIRMKGAMKCLIADGDIDVEKEIEGVRNAILPTDQIAQVSTPQIYCLPADGPKIAVLDMGCKLSILKSLSKRGFSLTVFPYNASVEQILESQPDGLFISNGPGDPTSVMDSVNTIRALVEMNIPTMGVCMGQQLLALSQGARTYKLKFGHRGANQPVKDLITGRTEITSQNHNFAVDASSLTGTGLEITHTNLNDGSVEGLRLKNKKAFAVQFHPEAAAGPHDSNHLFDRYLAMLNGKEDWENA